MSTNPLREKFFDPPKIWQVAHTSSNPVNFPLNTATPPLFVEARIQGEGLFCKSNN